MSDSNHVAYASIDEIEQMMVNLGAAELKSRGIGRASNYDRYAHERQAVLDPETKVVVGRIYQHVTAKNGPVTPRSVFFIYERAADGNLYLLKTNKGGGPKGTLKYNVYCSNGKFSKDPDVYGILGPRPSTHTAVAPVDSAATNVDQAKSSSKQVTDQVLGSKATPVVDDNASQAVLSGAVSEGTSAAPEKPKPGKKGQNSKAQGVSHDATPALNIPKSSTGIVDPGKKPGNKPGKPPKGSAAPEVKPARTRRNKLTTVEETTVAPETEESSQATNTNEDLQKIPSTASLFHSGSDPKHATVKKPLSKSAAAAAAGKNKRQREAEDTEYIHKRAKHLHQGWYADAEKADRERKTLIGFNVQARVRFVPGPNEWVAFPQFVLGDSLTAVRYDTDLRQIYGEVHPVGQAHVVEFPVNVPKASNKQLPAKIKARALPPATKTARLDLEEKADQLVNEKEMQKQMEEIPSWDEAMEIDTDPEAVAAAAPKSKKRGKTAKQTA